MPKNCKKAPKKNAFISLSDVKLSDYANSPYAGTIRKKPTINSLVKEVKDLCTIEKAWLDQECGDLKELSSDDESQATLSHKKKSRPKALKIKSDISGNTYPVDLWFLIGNYIKPEDVKIFASICKGSYVVSQTYSFWIRLYKRYYQAEKLLPLRLQPHCIERPFCLKASVIRALYYFYPQFTIKSPIHQLSQKVHELVKTICISMWYLQKCNGKWLFYFKFKSRHSDERSIASGQDNGPLNTWMDWDACNYKDPQLLINEVNRNSEEGCRILMVQSPNFVATPIVMGGCLADARVGLTRDLSKQKLQLTFSFSNYQHASKNVPSIGSRNCGGTGEVVEFDPVESITVLDWWHPQYPYSKVL